MNLPIRAILIAAFPFVVAGCGGQKAATPFNVVVRGPASSCTIEVEGRKVTTDELLAIARPEAKSGRCAHVDSDMAETPYRCLGGVIFTLQRAGFENVGFVAEPPPQQP